VSPSRCRALLYLAAILFGGATTFYSIFWMYYAPQSGAARIGAEFTYSLANEQQDDITLVVARSLA